jgi:hypothetical protein
MPLGGESFGPESDPSTGGGGGSGTVTSFSFVNLNGFAGTVTNASTTPALTLSTTVTGLLKGNGSAISAATAGTDYVLPSATPGGDLAGSGSTYTAPLLVTSGVTAGTYGDSTHVGQFTVDAKGRITSATAVAISGGGGSVTSVFGRTGAVVATSGDYTYQQVGALGKLVMTAVKTSAYSASASDMVAANTSAGSFTVTLPTTPADQTIIGAKIVVGSSAANGYQLTVAAGGSDVFDVAGGATTQLLSLLNQEVVWIYQASTGIWSSGMANLPRSRISANRVLSTSTTPITASSGDIWEITTGSSAFAVTLPASSYGNRVIIKKVDSGAGAITITPASGTIDGAATLVLSSQNAAVELVADGTNWLIIANNQASGMVGTVPVAQGGTGATTLTGLVVGNGTSAFTTVSAPTGTVVGTTDTMTLTNKRITKRIYTASAPGATPLSAVSTDSYDGAELTGLAAAITSMAPASSTPVAGDTFYVALTDNGTARAITWGSSFEASTVPLPTTTVASARLDVGFRWNTVTSKWRCIGVA